MGTAWTALAEAADMHALTLLPLAAIPEAYRAGLPSLTALNPDDAPPAPQRHTFGVAVGDALLSGRFTGPETAGATVCTLLHALPEDCDQEHEGEDAALFNGAEFNTGALYHKIKPSGTEPSYVDPPPGLAATLRPFQV